MKDKNKGATFWSCDDTIDYVTCTSPDEAVENYLESLPGDPEEVPLYSWGPVEIPDSAFSVLETLLDHLDENYGNEYTDPVIANDAMIAAEQKFIEVVKENYDPRSIQPTFFGKINVKHWRANR